MTHVRTLWRQAEAAALAATLNAGPEDDWSYQVQHDPAGTGGSAIGIFEPDGTLVEYL